MRRSIQHSGILSLIVILLLIGRSGKANVLNPCQYIADTSKNFDTLTVMYSASNYVYYYENELTIDEVKNNFNTTSNKGIKDLLLFYEKLAKDKKEKLWVILKIQAPEKLNASSKAAIASLKANYFYKEENLNEIESELIRITEEANGVKNQ